MHATQSMVDHLLVSLILWLLLLWWFLKITSSQVNIKTIPQSRTLKMEKWKTYLAHNVHVLFYNIWLMIHQINFSKNHRSITTDELADSICEVIDIAGFDINFFPLCPFRQVISLMHFHSETAQWLSPISWLVHLSWSPSEKPKCILWQLLSQRTWKGWLAMSTCKIRQAKWTMTQLAPYNWQALH